MTTAPAWTYQPPKRPERYPTQCYYRTGRWQHIARPSDLLDYPQVTLFRFEHDSEAKLQIELEHGSLKAKLTAAELTSLRDALNDALADIAAAEEDRERRESFELIQEELRDADELGGTGCLYAHPDVHYVADAESVAAKARELDAAGAARYMVLVDPAAAEVAA